MQIVFFVEVVHFSAPLRANSANCGQAEIHRTHCPGQPGDGAQSSSVDLCGAGHTGVHLDSGSLVCHIQTSEQPQQHLR